MQFFLQPRVVINVVVPQRLLDHQQVELVEAAQVLDLIESVGGVRIATERDVRPLRSNSFENIHIPARLDLDFDAPVARIQFYLDFFQKLLHRVLNSNRNTARDFASGPSQQLPQRQPLLSCFGIPQRIFNRSLRHAMGANLAHEHRPFTPRFDLTPNDRRREIARNRRPSAVNPFTAVKRILAGHAFAPSINSPAMSGDEKNAAAVSASETGLKKVDQRHANFAQSDGFDLHK